MSKHPPATDATPEALARAALRRHSSSADRGKGQTTSGAPGSSETEPEAPEIPSSLEMESPSKYDFPNDPDLYQSLGITRDEVIEAFGYAQDLARRFPPPRPERL